MPVTMTNEQAVGRLDKALYHTHTHSIPVQYLELNTFPHLFSHPHPWPPVPKKTNTTLIEQTP